MNFLNEFEQRIGSVFGDAPQGYTEPFSFKKLAKKAAREMEAETYDINDIATAPALYTVLVSPADDSLMRPLYQRLTQETAQYIAAEAEKRGYALVGMPLVRFMIDPSLRSGKFAVFAENVDYHALERLRAEEEAFMGSNSSLGGAASSNGASKQSENEVAAPMPVAAPISAPTAAGIEDVPGIVPLPEIGASPVAASLPEIDAGLDIIPQDSFDPLVQDSPSSSTPEVSSPSVPATQRRNIPLVDTRVPAVAAANVNATSDVASCLLVDRITGRTYTARAPHAVIGRERSVADVVLSDPNVSRQHAKLVYDGRVWHIEDLKSTNGTRVNDIDINECILSDGDLITCGLVSLEFRER